MNVCSVLRRLASVARRGVLAAIFPPYLPPHHTASPPRPPPCPPAMTDTDASACNPPTNPFVCTHHLPQIPLGKIHCQSIASSNTSIQPCFFLISSSGNAVQSRFLASACSLCNSYYRAPLLLPYSSYTRSFFFLIHLTPKVVFALLTILSWQCHLRCC